MIYLDSAATTNIYPAVRLSMEPYLDEFYGNASSHYELGNESKKAVERSREAIADLIGAKPEEIFFTSGGSEANSWVIRGFRNPWHINPVHVITSTQEHHSILNALNTRRNEHGDIIHNLVDLDSDGRVDVTKIDQLIRPTTRLCSIMMVNNETGVIQPIEKIAAICKERGIVFHTDAVQAFGFLDIDVKKMGIDMLSASAHKIHGPKGVGFLYISEDMQSRMLPLISGGQQERGLRGSTENVAGIVGFGAAVHIAKMCMADNRTYLMELGKELISKLHQLPGVHLNVNPDHTDYRHFSVRIDGVRAEEMLALLDSVGICVSSGSACNSDSNKPSHVLKAIGLTDDEANSTIRVSLNNQNTTEEMFLFIEYLKQFIYLLRGRQ